MAANDTASDGLPFAAHRPVTLHYGGDLTVARLIELLATLPPDTIVRAANTTPAHPDDDEDQDPTIPYVTVTSVLGWDGIRYVDITDL